MDDENGITLKQMMAAIEAIVANELARGNQVRAAVRYIRGRCIVGVECAEKTAPVSQDAAAAWFISNRPAFAR